MEQILVMSSILARKVLYELLTCLIDALICFGRRGTKNAFIIYV